MNIYLRSHLKYRLGAIHINISSLVEFNIIFVLFERLLVQFGMPSSIIYIIDILNLFFLIIMFTQKKMFASKKQQFTGVVISYCFIIILSIIVAFVNYTEWNGNPLFTLIELRNIIRFLIFFLTCVTFLNEESYRRIYKILVIFFFVTPLYNFWVALLQPKTFCFNRLMTLFIFKSFSSVLTKLTKIICSCIFSLMKNRNSWTLCS